MNHRKIIYGLVACVMSTLFTISCSKEEVEDGLFSVGPTKQVRFAPGNLAEDGRSLVAHQWDYGGLFGWGSGNNPGITSLNMDDYLIFNDWGTHVERGWRTLSIEEWDYVIARREKATLRRAAGKVNGVNGLILLPDIWALPEGCTFSAGLGGWEGNCYTLAQWQQMESAGAVFLPAAGDRWRTEVYNVGNHGFYWSSSPCNGRAYDLFFGGYYFRVYDGGNDRCRGFSVRLVKDKIRLVVKKR